MNSMVDSTMLALRSVLAWNEASMDLFAAEGRPLGVLGCFGVFLLVGVMGVTTTLVFSDMLDIGPQVYRELLDLYYLAWPLLGASVLGAVVIYAVEYCQWTMMKVAAALAPVCVLLAAGFFCLTARYPECALIVVALLHAMIFVVVRIFTAGRITSYSFHQVVGIACAVVAVITVSAWIAWCHLSGRGWSYERREELKEELASTYGLYGLPSWEYCQIQRSAPPAERNDEDVKSCARLELCSFFIWSCPLLESGLLFCMALFALIRAWYMRKSRSLSEENTATVQRAVFFLFALLVIGWIACAVGGANMGLSFALLRLLAVLFIAFSVWVLHTVPLRLSILNTTHSMLWRLLAPVRTSDWMKAVMLCFGGIFLLVFLVIDVIVGLGRRLVFRKPDSENGVTTERGEQLLNHLKKWHWPSVLAKTATAALLLTFVFVGTPKGCVLFLAWLTQAIKGLELWLVAVVYFFAGLLMFALPPMPGLAVYMGAGTILVAQTRDLGWTFWEGITFASGLSFLIKMVSVVMQYKLFGELLARSERVRRLVGVQKVGTLALQRILRDPGLHTDKAAILCGGPDWPTVVLCGILNVGLGKTLVGELPNVFVVVPYTYAGACWLEDRLMAVSNITILLICVLQNCSFLVALLLAASEATAYQADMRRSRAEHVSLHHQDKLEEDAARHYKTLTEWSLLSVTQRVMLVLAAVLECGAFWVSVVLTPLCFRDFSLARRISDTFEDGGLEGNILDILLPLGQAVMAAFLAGAVCLLLAQLETHLRLRGLGEDGKAPRSSARASHSSVRSAGSASRVSGSIPQSGWRRSQSDQAPRTLPGRFTGSEAGGAEQPRGIIDADPERTHHVYV